MNTYSRYLRTGKYLISTDNKKVAYLNNDNETKTFIETNFSLHYSKINRSLIPTVKRITKDFIFRRLTIKPINHLETTFKGSIFMINWDNDLKFFDLINNKVLIIFNNDSKHKKYVRDMKYFSSCFDLPFLYINKENVVIEKLVKKDEINHEDYYPKLIEKYIYYYQSKEPKKYMNFNKINNDIKNNWSDLFNDIKVNLPQKLICKKIPVFYMHGDLHYDNILATDKKLYFIDWEHTSFRPFFYDLFNVIFVDIMNYNNYSLLKKYINGYFDEYFILLFKAAGLEYYEEYRREYFLMFLLYRYLYFDLINNEKQGVINRYERLLKDIAPFWTN